jgi:galactonate dehydratase
VRIERIELIRVRRYLYLQIHTDAGISGLGEAGMWGYLGANEAVIRAWEPYLIGQDPLRIEHHWQYLYRNVHFRGGSVTGALGAIDMALWDILGKRYEVPVYQLLGGKVRDRMRIQTVVDGPTIDELVAKARQEVARGITALRITPFGPSFAAMRHDALIRDAVARVGALREAVGRDVDIGVEIHRRLSPGDAIVLAAELEPFHPLYYEDPIPGESIDSHADIARAIRLPLAAGERLHTIYEFRELLASGGARYARLDLGLAGGLTPGKKIAALAESFHAGVIPHGALSIVTTAAALHLDAAIPNFVLQDFMGMEEPPNSELLVDGLRVESGHVAVPERPGLGIALRPDVAQRFPPTPRVIETALRPDGSVVDR